MTIRPLYIKEAEFIAHRLAVETMNFEDEPIPPFDTRSPGKLESCLLEPFQTYDGKILRYHFKSRAALLFYLIAKNHCFSNGNKRMAVTLTMVFCYVNNRWMNIHPKALYKIANDVAESKPEERKVVLETLEKFFGKHILKNVPHE